MSKLFENAFLRWLRQPRHEDPWFPGQRGQYRLYLNATLDDELDIFTNPRDVIHKTQDSAVCSWHEEATFHIVLQITGVGGKARSIGHHTISTDRTEVIIWILYVIMLTVSTGSCCGTKLQPTRNPHQRSQCIGRIRHPHNISVYEVGPSGLRLGGELHL
jgi:hypothetical protein